MKSTNKPALNYMKIYIILIIVLSSQCLQGYKLVFGGIITDIFYILFFGGMFFLYINQLFNVCYKKNFNSIKQNSTLVFLIIFIFIISILESLNLTGSLLNLIFFCGLILYSIFIVYYYSQQEIVDIILLGCLLVTILNLIFITLFPGYSYGTDVRFTALKGSFIHRNALGSFMALSCIFSCITLISKDYRKKALASTCLILSFFLLIMSHSSTSLVCFFLTMIIILLTKKFSIKINVVLILLVMQAFFYALINSSNNILFDIFSYLGRDPTLTGRTFIWSAELMAVNLKPLLGYGYGIIWGTNSLTDFLFVRAGFNFGYDAHSGILELLLQIGIVGTIIFILVIIVIPSYKLYKSNLNSILKYLANAMFIYTLIYTLTEKSFSSRDFQMFFLLIFIVYINKSFTVKNNQSCSKMYK